MHRAKAMIHSYLVCQISPLESRVGANALVDGPSELIVQLPCFESEGDGSDGHEDWQGDEERLHVEPKVVRDEGILVQGVGGVPDLVELDSGIDENADVVEDQTDDLNGVLQPQAVPHEE